MLFLWQHVQCGIYAQWLSRVKRLCQHSTETMPIFMFDFHFSNIYVSKLVYFHFIAHLINNLPLVEMEILCTLFIRYIWLNISNRHVKLLWTCIEAINLWNICVNYWFKHSIKFDIFCTLVFCEQFFLLFISRLVSLYVPIFFSYWSYIVLKVIAAHVYKYCLSGS